MVPCGAPQVEKAAGPGHYGLFCIDGAVFLFPAPTALIRLAVPGRGADGDYPVLVLRPLSGKGRSGRQ